MKSGWPPNIRGAGVAASFYIDHLQRALAEGGDPVNMVVKRLYALTTKTKKAAWQN